MNTSLKSRMAAFQQAADKPHPTASSSSSKRYLPSSATKKKFGASSYTPTVPSHSTKSPSQLKKTSVGKLGKGNNNASFVPTTKSVKVTPNPSVGKLNINKKSFTPTVVSSSNTITTKPPSVGKLDKDKANLIAAVLAPGGGMGGGSAFAGTSASAASSSSYNGRSNERVIGTRTSVPFEKLSLTIGANTTQGQQEQNGMSEKAKHALVAPKEMDPSQQDWEHLYQLALQYEQLKQQGIEETKSPNSMPKSEARLKAPTKKHESGDKKNIKSSLEGLMGGTSFTANGNFLTQDFFDQYLVENTKFKSLTFDFAGQTKLFKRFDRRDAEQRSVSQKFVNALLKHPRAKDITILNMSNALLPDVFVITLAEQCLEQKGLPNLQVLNLESNLIAQNGVVALSKCITDPQVWRNLQILKLENQKMQFPSDAEEALGEALLECRSLVVVSLRVRGGLARQQINNSVAYNIDVLRQARRQHASKTGTLKERKRNEMEQYFDKIAANGDDSITTVDLTGNLKFLGLHTTERIKAATAFATNTTVKTIKMVKLKLDDAFAKEFGKALAANTTLEKVCLDSNEISGAGIKALLEGLGKNSSLVDFQVRHQSKTMASADEQGLPDLVKENKTVVKLGVDVRNPLIKTQMERKTNENRDWQRKQRNSQNNK